MAPPPPPPPPDGPEITDADVVQQLRTEVAELQGQLDSRNNELKRRQEEFQTAAEKLKQAEELDQTPGISSAGRAWWRIAAALMVGVVLGLGGGMLAKDWFDPPTEMRRSDIERLKSDIERLEEEAYAPLGSDLTNVSGRPPRGMSPDEVARRGLSADTVHVLKDRARAFLNHGIRIARDGKKSEAVYWYKQALRLCASDAMLYLGDAYLNGDGARRDARTGFQLMRVSSALGSRRAIDTIKAILRKGEQVPLAPPNFSELYQGARR